MTRVKFLVVCLSREEGVNSFLSFQSQPQNGDNDFNRSFFGFCLFVCFSLTPKDLVFLVGI